jgi:hypothetical protein
MGSCQSAHRDVAVSLGLEHKEVSPKKIVSKTTESAIGTVPSSFTTAPTQEVAHTFQDSKKVELQGSETECSITTVDLPDQHDHHLWRREEPLQPEKPPNTGKLPISKIKPGYSSGDSSEYSDDSGPNASPHTYLADWKGELNASGDLCKGVVRIEVSVWWGMYPRSKSLS